MGESAGTEDTAGCIGTIVCKVVANETSCRRTESGDGRSEHFNAVGAGSKNRKIFQ